QYQSGQTRRTISKNKTSKPAVNPYIVGFLLIMMSGGAIFQVLKLVGFAVDDDMLA
ncbi:hypothetical protein BGX27_000232, partial [Mortierella sp. AM989]